MADLPLMTWPVAQVYGVKVTLVRRGELLGWLRRFLAEGRGFASVCSVNAEGIMLYRRDETYRALVDSADIRIADGMGAVMALRLAQGVGTEQITGTDLADGLLALAAELGAPVVIIGGKPTVVAQTLQRLGQEHPRLKITAYSPPFNGRSDGDFDERIRSVLGSASASVVLVCLNQPKQEWVLERIVRETPGTRVALGVGGWIDFKAGVATRAPVVLRRLCMEWLFRLVMQPWRWRRQLAVIRFIALVLAGWFRRLAQGAVRGIWQPSLTR